MLENHDYYLATVEFWRFNKNTEGIPNSFLSN